MPHALAPTTIAPPFARYSHDIEIPAGARVVMTSGQLGVAADGAVPAGAADQARLCCQAIDAILAEAGMTRADVVRINAYLTDRADMADYMAVRDAWMADVSPPPASTLLLVSGFTRPEFKVEIEVTAAAPPAG